MDHICDWTKEKGLIVLEDSAHAHGAKLKDKYMGTWGRMAIFSYQATKPLPAIEGLFGKPTVVNNVVTLASVPNIINLGGERYADFYDRITARGIRPMTAGGDHLMSLPVLRALARDRRLAARRARRKRRLAGLQVAQPLGRGSSRVGSTYPQRRHRRQPGLEVPAGETAGAVRRGEPRASAHRSAGSLSDPLSAPRDADRGQPG